MPGQHVNEDSGPRISDPARVAITAEAVLVTPAPTTPANFTFHITDNSASDTCPRYRTPEAQPETLTSVPLPTTSDSCVIQFPLRPVTPKNHFTFRAIRPCLSRLIQANRPATPQASSSTHPEDTANDHLDRAIELGNQAIAGLRDVLQERLAAEIPEPPAELPAAPSYPVVIPQYYRLPDILCDLHLNQSFHNNYPGIRDDYHILLENGLQHRLSEPYDDLPAVTIPQTQQHEAALCSVDARYIRIYRWKPQPLFARISQHIYQYTHHLGLNPEPCFHTPTSWSYQLVIPHFPELVWSCTPAEVIFHTDRIVDKYYASYELIIKFTWYPRYPIINVTSLMNSELLPLATFANDSWQNARAYKSLPLEVRIAINIFVIPVNILDTYHCSTGLLHLFPHFNTPVALPAPLYSV
ncbi:hypothetical protein V8D89_008185 [Ganoderma adspersum]